MVFSTHRLAVLHAGEAVVYDTEHWKLDTTLPLEQPRAVVRLADGSLLFVGGRASLRLAPQKRHARRLPKLTLLPDSQLWPDRRWPNVVWLQTARGLFRYELPPAHGPVKDQLLPTDQVELTQYDGTAFVGLKDGSFLYAANEGLSHFFPQGRVTTSPKTNDPIWRLLATHRIDQAWAADRSGTLRLLQLGGRLPVVRTLALDQPCFDIASSDTHLGIIVLTQPPDGPRHWSLRVYDNTGKLALERGFPAEPEPDGRDWVGRLLSDRGLALAPTQPYVAAGGPTQVRVWSLKTGAELLAAPVTTKSDAVVAPTQGEDH